MRLQLLYFDGCPNWVVAEQRLVDALADLDQDGVEVERVLVATPDAAERWQFRGSPTVLVDGRDPFAEGDAPVGLACRVYRTEAGLAGAPTREQLVEALRPLLTG